MFRSSRSIAVLLDIAPFVVKGKRSVDIVKKQLVEFVRTFDQEDLFYLYNPVQVDVMDNRGDQIGVIGNYDTDGYKISDIAFAFKQTYYVLAAQDEDTRRVFCYLTNRFSKKEASALKRIFTINRSLGLLEENCNFLVIGIGNQLDKEELSKICESKADLLFLEDPNNLNNELQNYFDSTDE